MTEKHIKKQDTPWPLEDGSTITPFQIAQIKDMSVAWVLTQHEVKKRTANQILDIETPKKRRRHYWADGTYAPVREVAARAAEGVQQNLVYSRLAEGWTPEDAIQPIGYVRPVKREEPARDPMADPVVAETLRMPLKPKWGAWLSRSWDQRHMALARFWSENSKDPSTKVGAVIVGRDKREVCLGYNGFPPGIADDERLLDRSTKYPLMIHAERNALDNARFDTQGATLYATLAPCCGCASSIVSKGIKRVVCPKPDLKSDLAKRHGIKDALAILEEGGVTVEWEVLA
jgi:dCMP deaminase